MAERKGQNNKRPFISRAERASLLQESTFVAETNHTIALLQQKYGVEVKLGDEALDVSHDLTTTPVSIQQGYRGVRSLYTELAKYPPEYIRSSGLSKIVLVDSLSAGTIKYGGLRLGDNSGVYVVVYQDDRRYTQGSIHHELEHQAKATFSNVPEARIFFKDRRSLYATTRQDMVWGNRMIAEGAEYVGELARTHSQRKPKGFAREYGRFNLDEDQATIVEQLMMRSQSLSDRCKHDAHLAAKVESMKVELKRRTGGRIDEQYFADLQAGRVGPDYWDHH